MLASFWRDTSPAGATQESPGRKPWEQAQEQGKPRRGDAVGPGTKEAPYDEHLSGVEIELPAPPFQGFPQFGP